MSSQPVSSHHSSFRVPQNGLQAEFMEWTAAEQAAGNITFAIKLASGAGSAAIADGLSGTDLLQRGAIAAVQHSAALL